MKLSKDSRLTLEANKTYLVYYDENGDEYMQPASSVVEIGTLIDPVTGDDMEVDHVVYVA
jgi:hypothetical protein